MLRAASLTALLLVASLPAVGAEAFEASLPFTDFATATHMPVLAGSLDVRAPAGGAPTLMHNVTSFEVSGLAVACWEYPCHDAEGPLSIQVAAGSTVALRFPRTGNLHLAADHAVLAPVDLDAEESGFSDLSASLSLAPSLVAATQAGILRFDRESLPATPDGAVPADAPPGLPSQVGAFFQAPDPDDENGAVLAALTPTSRLEVVDAGRVIHTVEGFGALLLQGEIAVEPVGAQAFVLPCAVRCDLAVTNRDVTAHVQAAADAIADLVALVEGGEPPAFDLGPWAGLLDPVADGVFLDVPLVSDPGAFSVADLTLVRFDSFKAELYPEAPAVPGSGPLVIQDGTVQGSPEFVGGRYFGMPLWSYFLWAAAIVAVLVALITRGGKHSERWDSLQWIGRVAGAIAWAILVLVWHVNFGRVLGVDATTPGLDLTSRLLVGALELVTLLAMAVMVVLPVRLLAGAVFRTLRQGRFMGLAGPLASVVGILAGTPLLLGFLDLALRLFQ